MHGILIFGVVYTYHHLRLCDVQSSTVESVTLHGCSLQNADRFVLADAFCCPRLEHISLEGNAYRDAERAADCLYDAIRVRQWKCVLKNPERG